MFIKNFIVALILLFGIVPSPNIHAVMYFKTAKSSFFKSLRTSPLYKEKDAEQKNTFMENVKRQYEAATAGNAEAQNYIGMICIAIYDFAEAKYWFEKSAKQGHVEAQLYLASIYQNGFGLSRNEKKAKYWFEQAAKQGSVTAPHSLKDMPEIGDSAQTQRPLLGQIKNGRYYDPTGNFSILSINGCNNYIVDDHDLFTPNVSFQDDVGGLISIKAAVLPKDIMRDIVPDLKSHPLFFNNLIESFIKDIQSDSPDAKRVYTQDKIIDGIGYCYFAIISIPKDTTWVNSDTGEAQDTSICYMYSFCGDQTVTIASQKLNGGLINADQATLNTEMINRLIEIRKTYKNERA